MVRTTNSKPKLGFHIPGEAYLIGVVVLLMGVMLNHVAEGWMAFSFTHNFTGDPLTGTGWWGKQTSAMNFCEEDYTSTPAIAEFINVISNSSYMYFAWSTWPKGLRWPPLTNMGLLLVGLVSSIFHASLTHHTQIADESGMYLLTGSIDWYLYSYPGAIIGGSVSKPVFGTLLWGACAAVVYMNFTASGADFGIHTMLFIALLTALWPRAMWLIAKRRRLEKQGLMPAAATKARYLRRRFRIGGGCFLLGFGLWVVDCAFCYELRVFREMVGVPLAWLSEMHAWWHVLTAVGAGAFVEISNTLSSVDDRNVQMKEQGKAIEMNGHVSGGEVKEQGKATEMNGHASNGEVKLK